MSSVHETSTDGAALVVVDGSASAQRGGKGRCASGRQRPGEVPFTAAKKKK